MTTLNPIADAVEGLISPVVGPLMARLIDLIPDPAEKARQAALAQQALMAADAQIIAAQNATNLAEAQNNNIFVSGWRPAVGWTCVAGLAWQYVLSPAFSFFTVLFGYAAPNLAMDSTLTQTLLIPLLGLGAMKTYERVQGVSNEGQTAPTVTYVQPHQSVLDLPSATPPSNALAGVSISNAQPNNEH